jgi:DNA polymerase III gamma/tau subunit
VVGPLSVRYQPRVFEDFVGREIVRRYLSTRIMRDDPRHVILYGSEGSGKSSIARIYARAIHCKAVTPQGSPCNRCDECRLLLGDAHIDAGESSAAAWSDVGEAILRVHEATNVPPWGRWRTNIIRECDAIPKSAWDLLLKTIERPPLAHVLIFTTSRLSLIPQTVRSRCHKLEVSLLDRVTAMAWLKQLASVEAPSYEPAALRLIAYISAGRPGRLIDNLGTAARSTGSGSLDDVRSCFSLNYIDPLARVWRSLLGNSAAALDAALSEWPAAPATILDKCREFLLFLIGVCRHGAPDSFDPMFEYIPGAEIAYINSLATTWGTAAGLSLEGALLVMTELLSGLDTSTLSSLEADLHHFMERLHAPPPPRWDRHLPVTGSYAAQLRRSLVTTGTRRIPKRHTQRQSVVKRT